MDNLILLTADEQQRRLNKVRTAMADNAASAALICDKANIYYLTGRVFSGYIYLSLTDDANGGNAVAGMTDPVYFVKRPVGLHHERCFEIRKPENMLEHLQKLGIAVPETVAYELADIPYAMVDRLAKALAAPVIADCSAALAQARATKTQREISMLRISGAKHERVYRKIPYLYQAGMTDMELQVEIERLSRLEGCLGQFRIAGTEMELFMGNVLAGDNADSPSPYDFAMGGAGMDPSLPVGANGTVIRPGMAVMVDMNGNFNGYMTDMTRCFACGQLSEEALKAHQLSIAICQELRTMGRPGVPAKELYDKALEMATAEGLHNYFMGHRQHAGFVGHGVGIEVNELPVLAPRSRDILAEGNVIAIEPKFVIPGAGAVGIENTYVVTKDGMEKITNAPEEIIYFDK